MCAELNIAVTNSENGDSVADDDCRSKTVDGSWTNVTGVLSEKDLKIPGRWIETIHGNQVNYTVIAISEDYAVEYDCGTSLGITNYCIHVMSRQRTLDESIVDELFQYAESLGLNPQGLPVKMTKQEGC